MNWGSRREVDPLEVASAAGRMSDASVRIALAEAQQKLLGGLVKTGETVMIRQVIVTWEIDPSELRLCVGYPAMVALEFRMRFADA